MWNEGRGGEFVEGVVDIRVALVDEHQLYREGLRFMLEAQTDVRVVFESSGARDALAHIDEHNPDVIILNLDSSPANSLATIRELKRRAPQRRVLVLSERSEEAEIAEALHAGAVGYFLEKQSVADLAEAVRGVARGERYVPPSLSIGAIDDRVLALLSRKTIAGPLDRLSTREREIFELLVTGHGNAEVAGDLSISVATVETHRAHIFRKLDVHSLADLIRWAVRHNLLRS